MDKPDLVQPYCFSSVQPYEIYSRDGVKFTLYYKNLYSYPGLTDTLHNISPHHVHNITTVSQFYLKFLIDGLKERIPHFDTYLLDVLSAPKRPHKDIVIFRTLDGFKFRVRRHLFHNKTSCRIFITAFTHFHESKESKYLVPIKGYVFEQIVISMIDVYKVDHNKFGWKLLKAADYYNQTHLINTVHEFFISNVNNLTQNDLILFINYISKDKDRPQTSIDLCFEVLTTKFENVKNDPKNRREFVLLLLDKSITVILLKKMLSGNETLFLQTVLKLFFSKIIDKQQMYNFCTNLFKNFDKKKPVHEIPRLYHTVYCLYILLEIHLKNNLKSIANINPKVVDLEQVHNAVKFRHAKPERHTSTTPCLSVSLDRTTDKNKEGFLQKIRENDFKGFIECLFDNSKTSPVKGSLLKKEDYKEILKSFSEGFKKHIFASTPENVYSYWRFLTKESASGGSETPLCKTIMDDMMETLLHYHLERSDFKNAKKMILGRRRYDDCKKHLGVLFAKLFISDRKDKFELAHQYYLIIKSNYKNAEVENISTSILETLSEYSDDKNLLQSVYEFFACDEEVFQSVAEIYIQILAERSTDDALSFIKTHKSKLSISTLHFSYLHVFDYAYENEEDDKLLDKIVKLLLTLEEFEENDIYTNLIQYLCTDVSLSKLSAIEKLKSLSIQFKYEYLCMLYKKQKYADFIKDINRYRIVLNQVNYRKLFEKILQFILEKNEPLEEQIKNTLNPLVDNLEPFLVPAMVVSYYIRSHQIESLNSMFTDSELIEELQFYPELLAEAMRLLILFDQPSKKTLNSFTKSELIDLLLRYVEEEDNPCIEHIMGIIRAKNWHTDKDFTKKMLGTKGYILVLDNINYHPFKTDVEILHQTDRVSSALALIFKD
jgi:hypothetical protein